MFKSKTKSVSSDVHLKEFYETVVVSYIVNAPLF